MFSVLPFLQPVLLFGFPYPLDQEEPTVDDEDEKDGEDKGEDAETDPEPKSKKRKTSWFDRDTAIASKVRQETTQLCTLTSQLEQRIAECHEVLQSTADQQALAEDVQVEKDTLLKRLDFLEAVMLPAGTKLEELIKGFGEASQQKEKADKPDKEAVTVTATSWAGQLAAAPPCQSFESLTTLASWRDSLESYWQCQSQTELKELAKQRATNRKPIAELNAACGAGLKELKKAINNFKTRMEKALPKSGAKKKGSGAQPASFLFDKGVEMAKGLQVLQMGDSFEAVDFTCPFLAKLNEDQVAKLRSEPWLQTVSNMSIVLITVFV